MNNVVSCGLINNELATEKQLHSFSCMSDKGFLKKLYVIFFLVIFTGYYACVTFFYHTHVVLGETICHSHPYKAGADGKPIHSHTDKGYITIYLLSTLTFSIVAFTFGVKRINAILYQIQTVVKQGTVTEISFCLAPLRAPPRYC